MEQAAVTKNTVFYLLVVALAGTVALAYSNHFGNSFHFDDSHVIEQNLNVRSIGNIPRFFADATTFSALPANQTYRPVLSTFFAVAYRLGGGSPRWFHVMGFSGYLVLWMLLFFLFRRVFTVAGDNGLNEYAALLGASFYILHTANAETVNYVSAASDLLSTLLMVAALLLYAARPAWRKLGFYLLPATLAMLTKEVSVIFPLLLLAYLLIIEKKIPLSELLSKERRQAVGRALAGVLPAALVCLGLLALSAHMLPKTYVPSSLARLEYVLAQPFVILHYFLSFLLPFNLSADSDWQPLGNIFDDRVLVGVAFLAFLVAAAVWASRQDRTSPLAFGLLWFLIGVLPPSSGIVPLAEVLNDHRMFLPFIGLALAASWSLLLLFQRYDERCQGNRVFRAGVAMLLVGVFAGHAYGTFQRNHVWRDEESLWLDVTQKSPQNPRGLMNYGLARMAKGDTRGALELFEKGLLVAPNYVYLQINSAIARDALGGAAKAEQQFKKAIDCYPGYFGCYYYYGRFLQRHNRLPEAIPLLQKAVDLSPGFSEAKYLLMRIYTQHRDWQALGRVVEDSLHRSPDDAATRSYQEIVRHAGDPVRVQELAAATDPTPENYLWLSLAYCQDNQFQKCIEASRQALQLKPDCVEAYNNIGYAHLRLEEKSEAIAACERALAIDPQFELARNNLKLAQGLK